MSCSATNRMSRKTVEVAVSTAARKRLIIVGGTHKISTSSTVLVPSLSPHRSVVGPTVAMSCSGDGLLLDPAPKTWKSFPTARQIHTQVMAKQTDATNTNTNTNNTLDGEKKDTDDHERQQDYQPWRSLLELPARASWRSSDPRPPNLVVEAQVGVLNAGGATAKQLRRTHANIVASHKALAERRERERRRLINRTHYARRAQQRDEEVQPVFYGKLETLSFLQSRLHPNYAITKRVLEETKSLLGYSIGKNNCAWKPRRIIDMGIGVGSASAAALEVFEQDVEWVHGIDPSRCMRECSKEFLEEIMEKMTTNQQEQGLEHQQQRQRVNPPRLTLSGSISAEASSSTFDLALFTYTATELPHVASSLAAAAILWQKLSKDGVFVMIEPGTPDGFNSIRAVRNMLLDCCPPNGQSGEYSGGDDDKDAAHTTPAVFDQCHIIAPCTHNGKCPMERYQHDFLRQKNPKTQMDYIPAMNNDSFDDEDDWEEEIDDEEDDSYDDDDDDDDDEEEEEDVSPAATMIVETDFLSRRFCSFVQTMSSGSHLNKGEKFSYLVAQKRIPHLDNHKEYSIECSFRNDKLRDLLANVYKANEIVDIGDEKQKQQQMHHVQNLFETARNLESRYLDSEEDDLGLEFLQGDVNRESFGRIIRAPLKKRGHVFIDYCAAPGRLMRSRVSKALDYRVAPGLFTAARKSRWGGLWPDVAAPSPDDTSESTPK